MENAPIRFLPHLSVPLFSQFAEGRHPVFSPRENKALVPFHGLLLLSAAAGLPTGVEGLL